MKDRIPKFPGRVMITPVSGQTNIYDMVRADEPEEAGTPMNKQTLLTDEAAADVGLDPDGDYTPNDAFALLGKYTARKVGDILETVRTDIGDRWLLCNGDILWDGQYPKLQEILPYNTDWRRVAPFQDFDRVQAIYGKPGQWALISSKVAALYDAKTETVTEIGDPTVGGSSSIIGLSHDGDRYILGVRRYVVNAENNYGFFLYTSTDLANWTKAHEYTITGYHDPYDMIYDGTGTLVAAEYYSYTNNQSSLYDVRVYHTNKEMTKTTAVSGYWTPAYLRYFAVVPGGWFFTGNDSESLSVYSPGVSRPSLFFFSHNGKVAFFSEKYWIGTPSKGKSAGRIEIYNTETKEKSDFSVEDLFAGVGVTASKYYTGCEYNKNTNEWELYLHTNESGANTHRYYIAYISADSDPSDAANYRTVRVESLPELHNVQMAPDRSKMTAGSLLRDPNQKYLPSHDGDTYKYIYAGTEA